jgi:hypothetical protein
MRYMSPISYRYITCCFVNFVISRLYNIRVFIVGITCVYGKRISTSEMTGFSVETRVEFLTISYRYVQYIGMCVYIDV